MKDEFVSFVFCDECGIILREINAQEDEIEPCPTLKICKMGVSQNKKRYYDDEDF